MSLRRLMVVSLFVGSLLAHARAAAQAPQCVSVKGALFAQKKVELLFDSVKPGAAVPKDRLLVSLFEADLRSGNGAVDLRLHGDVGEVGPLPALETAIRIHDNPKVDLELTLERGIIVLVNKKKDGSAQVDVRIRDKTLNVVLQSPGAKLGIDLYSRHAPGSKALKEDNPTSFLFVLNLEGSVQVAIDGKTIALQAPPGPALLRWDSALHEPFVEHLDKLPDWTKRSPADAKLFEQINKAVESIGHAFPHAAFLQMVNSNDPVERKVGLTAVGALGTPAPLFAALRKSKHADARQFAILVMRAWLGHGPGQLHKLETAFGTLGLSKTDIESLLHLFLGFDDEERQEPVTYQLLIEGLHHSKLLVRELSYWHLQRMAPAGHSIAYDPAGTAEQIQAGVRQWRELIPAGKLPPAPKK